MAITQAMCTSFKQALLDGEMDFSSDTAQSYKIALIKSGSSVLLVLLRLAIPI